METGIKGEMRIQVTAENTAKSIGSGTLDVFATPAMIALIEETASKSVSTYLEQGQSTVGTHLDIAHTSATPIGMEVVCTTELVEVDRRRLVFKATVCDAKGEIGSGTHERFIVDNEKFMSKAGSKLARSRI